MKAVAFAIVAVAGVRMPMFEEIGAKSVDHSKEKPLTQRPAIYESPVEAKPESKQAQENTDKWANLGTMNKKSRKQVVAEMQIEAMNREE